MYKPWQPLSLAFSCHPLLNWKNDGRTLQILAEFWMTGAAGLKLSILFEEGLAGFHAFDESTYQSVEDLLGPNLLDGEGFDHLPWPFWISRSNDRINLYGDLGQLCYKHIDTYWLVGAETVLWFDIADAEPKVSIVASPQLTSDN